MVTSSSNLLKTLELLLARLEFIMSHLLPVQMDTLIKFLRFLRCSWTTKPNWAERFFEKWASEYVPESPTGLEGVDFGEDAVTIQDNILDQVLLACSRPWSPQLVDLFCPNLTQRKCICATRVRTRWQLGACGFLHSALPGRLPCPFQGLQERVYGDEGKARHICTF